jgi:hypothetical protein
MKQLPWRAFGHRSAKAALTAAKDGNTILLGNLRLWQLALGAIIFTV